jgi:hypothetical protein
MKSYRFREDGREDVRDDERYAMLIGVIGTYLRQALDMDCKALVVIAVCANGRVNIMNGGKSVDFDFNQMLAELVEAGIDLNRPGEGGIN